MVKAAASDPTDIPPEVPDERVDALYGLPLDEFTAARDALAKDLRKEGERPGAEWVKACASQAAHTARALSPARSRHAAQPRTTKLPSAPLRAGRRREPSPRSNFRRHRKRSARAAELSRQLRAKPSRRAGKPRELRLTSRELERARAAHLEPSSRVEELGRAVESDGDGG
jgi:hypothetical protein